MFLARAWMPSLQGAVDEQGILAAEDQGQSAQGQSESAKADQQRLALFDRLGMRDPIGPAFSQQS